MGDSADLKLTKALTDIDETLIDTFTDFPTAEAIDLQTTDRQLGNIYGLKYYRERADLTAECMRSWDRGSRQEAVLAKYQDKGMYDRMVGIVSTNEGEKKGVL